MPDIQAALRSYQISWLRRAVNNEEDNVWRNWLDELFLKSNGINFNQLMMSGNKQWRTAANKIESSFWKDVFKSYNRMVDNMITMDRSKTLNMTIWDSTFFKANNRRFLNPRVQRFLPLSNFAITPLDCLSQEGTVLSQPELDQKFGQEVPHEILEAVTRNFSHFPQGEPLPRVKFEVWPFFIPFNYEIITKYKKGCSY